jgi:hypothetical protein
MDITTPPAVFGSTLLAEAFEHFCADAQPVGESKTSVVEHHIFCTDFFHPKRISIERIGNRVAYPARAVSPLQG